jgi:hypothetical protein
MITLHRCRIAGEQLSPRGEVNCQPTRTVIGFIQKLEEELGVNIRAQQNCSQ